MALRVPKAELPTGLSENMIKQFGAVPEPVEVMWHNPKVAEAGLVDIPFERLQADVSPVPLEPWPADVRINGVHRHAAAGSDR